MAETAARTDLTALVTAAHTALRDAVAGVPADGWDLPTPCAGWTVTQVLQHAAGDQLAFAAALTGGPGPADDPFSPSGRLGGEPAALLEPALDAAAAAWAGVPDDAEQVPSPIPPHAFPRHVAAVACALDAAVHAWDIAVATGRPGPLTSETAAPLLGAAGAFIEPLRGYGAYAPALPPERGEDAVAALLRYLGRDPRWTPGA
ncbi:TIGR03086 family metal-binding protein [Streptomyces avicenniae]|uniref:TIGR03086 family metal-binding protein n=1 Tax=Streptomyces avicenniae TaxID=500153 RepID=UPI00069CA3FA|nr:TIGR03086 family metal-binding protein [Streptomyces avicenniae]